MKYYNYNIKGKKLQINNHFKKAKMDKFYLKVTNEGKYLIIYLI